MVKKITNVKNSVTAVIKKYKWSTDRAIVEAWSGWMGIPCIKSSSLALPISSHLHSYRRRPLRVVAFTAKHHEHENSQNQHGKKASRSHNIHHDEAVFSSHRIVLVAIEQRVIGRSDNRKSTRLNSS